MNKWDEINNTIESDSYKYISFDVFDTLLLRPLWEPTDLFFFLGLYAKEQGITNNISNFIDLRIKAEKKARIRKENGYEDITIEDIYLIMFNNNPSYISQLIQHEKDLELYFCYKRNSGYELYKKAVTNGKKVICISDMYLKEEDIRNLLKKNGYDKFEKIYVSSTIGLGKYTGKLYQYVKKDLKLEERNTILHIGDNFASDYLSAIQNGFDAFYLPKTKDVYMAEQKKKYSGNIIERINMALEANTLWDNPFVKTDTSGVDFDMRLFQKYKDAMQSCNIVFAKESFVLKMKSKIKRKIGEIMYEKNIRYNGRI